MCVCILNISIDTYAHRQTDGQIDRNKDRPDQIRLDKDRQAGEQAD